jgi:hypothetical protein
MSPATVHSSIQVRIARTMAPAIPSIRTGVTTEAAGPRSRFQTRLSALCGSGRRGIGRNLEGPTGRERARPTMRLSLQPLASDRWPDDRRLSDLKSRFICSGCGKRGADVRPDFNWNKKPGRMMGYR